MPITLNDPLIKQLAAQGAKARLAQLDEERTALLKMFPTLRVANGKLPVSTTTAPTDGRTRHTLSAAQRKAIGQRMKKYWAERRAAKAPKK